MGRARPQRARELVCPSTMLARRALPAKQETMMDKSTDKSPKTRAELEALVLAELRAVPQCGGALHVTVVGTSEQEQCELALCDIVSRLQRCFDISP